MNSQLFAIDPMAASSYGVYNSLKGEEGTFLDFLLSYDSKAANDNDNSWLSDLVTKDNIKNITSPELLQTLSTSGFSPKDSIFNKSFTNDVFSDISSHEVLKTMSGNGFATVDLLSSKSYFDTQVEGYKLQILKEMQNREMAIPKEMYE